MSEETMENHTRESQAAPELSAGPSEVERQTQQIAELKEMMAGVLRTVEELQAQASRDAQFHEAVEAVKEMRTVARTVLTAPTRATEYAAAHPRAETRDCGCGHDCVSDNCCCFDIMLSTVRVLAMQPLELDDSIANPWGEIEFQAFAYLLPDMTGTVFPSLFTTITLRKLIQHAGLQVTIGRKVGRVCVPKGQTRLQEVGADVLESDSGLIERATGGRDEEGTGRGILTLACCTGITPTCVFDVPFTSGGQGGGAVQLTFTAIPV
jgi:hypothetical protein